jgi:hypothetical protein
VVEHVRVKAGIGWPGNIVSLRPVIEERSADTGSEIAARRAPSCAALFAMFQSKNAKRKSIDPRTNTNMSGIKIVTSTATPPFWFRSKLRMCMAA